MTYKHGNLPWKFKVRAICLEIINPLLITKQLALQISKCMSLGDYKGFMLSKLQSMPSEWRIFADCSGRAVAVVAQIRGPLVNTMISHGGR